MNIIFFTKYSEKGPSSRYRSYQYKYLFEREYNITFIPFFDDQYIGNLYNGKATNYLKVFLLYLKRILISIKFLGTNKIVFVEYELLPYFPPILEYLLYKTNVKLILDYDDAIFHNYDLNSNFFIRNLLKNKIPTIVKYSSTVIAGSPYLYDYLSQFNKNVVEIPTSINFTNYNINFRLKDSIDDISIGWIGSKSTSINVINIKEVIIKILYINPKIKFKFMGFDSSLKTQLNFSNVEFFEWSEKNELFFLNEIDLGIMPLDDNPFNRGKCGFKLIQYMAMGKPTLSTPLEANVKIDRGNNNLFATTIEQWLNCIIEFSNNLEYYREVGKKNRFIVEKYYSVENNSIIYNNIFKQILNVRN